MAEDHAVADSRENELWKAVAHNALNQRDMADVQLDELRQALAALEAQLRAEVGTDGGTDYSDYRRGINEAFSACADALTALLAGPPKE